MNQVTHSDISFIFMNYICPSLGCLMSYMLYAAPIQDLRKSLKNGSLGTLNPFPWVMMAGNCAGWAAYGYFRRDPFVIVSSSPGLVVSLWLNAGASKLQYLEKTLSNKMRDVRSRLEMDQRMAGFVRRNEEEKYESVDFNCRIENKQHETSTDLESQETSFLLIIVAWVVIIFGAQSFSREDPGEIVGIAANVNLVFFYAAPLQMIRKIVTEKTSDYIHIPTMIMTTINSTFWFTYGLAQNDLILALPNAAGLLIGMAQLAMCLKYPRKPLSLALFPGESFDDIKRKELTPLNVDVSLEYYV